jgi:hypothetical protein
MKITRTDWKYIVDTLMFLCMLGIVLIGLLMGFVIPEGRLGPGQSKYFLGVHRHQWGDIHLYLSLAFTALIIVHIVLAWSWAKGKAKGLFGKAWKAAVGLTVLAALLVPLVFWTASSKNDPAYAEFGEGHGQQSKKGVVESGRPELEPLRQAASTAAAGTAAETRDSGGEAPAAPEVHGDKIVAGRQEAGTAEAVITGKMTLREVERATGIPANDLAAKVGLPADVSLDETLGRLRQAYGFEMQAVRDAIAEILKAKRPPVAP